MRFISYLSVILVSLCASAVTLPSRSTVCTTELPCDTNYSFSPAAERALSHPIERLSNAERLKRGLPLKPPSRRLDVLARRADPSAVVMQTRRGVIQVKQSSNGNSLGYVSRSTLSYAATYSTLDNALIVSFPATDSATSVSSTDLTMENFSLDYTYLGLVQGRDSTNSNIGSSSSNYLYLNFLKDKTTKGAPAQPVGNYYTDTTGNTRPAESAVWNIDLTTGHMTPQWVNADGSVPGTETWSQSTALYAGGSQSAFASQYPATTIAVYYTFVPL